MVVKSNFICNCIQARPHIQPGGGKCPPLGFYLLKMPSPGQARGGGQNMPLPGLAIMDNFTENWPNLVIIYAFPPVFLTKISKNFAPAARFVHFGHIFTNVKEIREIYKYIYINLFAPPGFSNCPPLAEILRTRLIAFMWFQNPYFWNLFHL